MSFALRHTHHTIFDRRSLIERRRSQDTHTRRRCRSAFEKRSVVTRS